METGRLWGSTEYRRRPLEYLRGGETERNRRPGSNALADNAARTAWEGDRR
jgi:hypothetical protein